MYNMENIEIQDVDYRKNIVISINEMNYRTVQFSCKIEVANSDPISATLKMHSTDHQQCK